MISAFQRQIEHLTDSVARNFGDVVRVETADGRVATVRAVYLPSTLTTPVTDSGAEVHDPAARLDFRLADLIAASLSDPRNDLFDATVTLRGEGVGGRNQEFALALALALGEDGIYALSAGSDGIDGSSDAAGAFLTPDTLKRARALGLNPGSFLEGNDSGTFFAQLGDALVTGPSGHNLNDFRALWVGIS